MNDGHAQIKDFEAKSKINRLRAIAVGFVALSLLILVKLFLVQVVNEDKYQLMAKRQYERNVALDAERGIVYDRNMNKIAVNLKNFSFAADPSFMPDKYKDRVADNFARVFQKPRSEYKKLLDKKNTAFVWLERKVSESIARDINDSVQGLIKLESLRRYYPYGKVAAQVIGFTNIDNRGASGIELDLQDELGGDDGWAILQADALGRLEPSPEYPHQDPINGNNVVLTLDINYQTIAQQELEKAIDDYNADDGMVVILSPITGEVLAMVNAPSFDPNALEKNNAALFRNRIITDLYEPGSTFKAISAVSAIEEKVVSPDDKINCENGQIRIYDQVIHDSRKHGIMSFTQVVEKSSNIGIIKTTQKLGADRLYQYIRAFGFGNETGIDLDGEVKGELKLPTQWSGLTMPMMSIGQEIGVTALQLANAYCAISNGGKLLKPYMIKSIINGGERMPDKEPQVIRTIASKETMGTVSQMLREAVMSGTGHRAQIKGIEIAGKTGTAQKVEAGKRGYADGKYTASFVGFFPVQNPQLVFLVIVNNPRKSIWGEASAAVTARTIVEKIINSSDDYAKQISRVMAEIDRDSTEVDRNEAPDLKYLTVDAAESILEKLHLEYQIIGKGEMVAEQKLATVGKKTVLQLLTTDQIIDQERGDPNFAKNDLLRSVPDVRGLSTRVAMNKLFSVGVDVRVKGSGFVVGQSPKAGARIQAGETVIIQCRPVM